MAIFDFFQWTRVLPKWNDVLPITSGSTDLFFAAGEALGGDVAGQKLSLGAGALILRVRHRLVQMSKPRQKSKQKLRSSGSSLAGQTRIDVWNYRTVNVRYAGRSTGVHQPLLSSCSRTFACCVPRAGAQKKINDLFFFARWGRAPPAPPSGSASVAHWASSDPL